LRVVGSDDAERLAKQIRSAVANFRFAHDGRLIAPTTSIGVVPFLAQDFEFATLFAHADAACYAAKELGGNRVQLAAVDEKLLLSRRDAMDWAVRLGDAIEQGHLQLYAQSIEALRPIASSGRHLEILLRVHDPDTDALIEPGPFIAAAERFKFGPRLDRAVVGQTLDWLDARPEITRTIDLVSINLSGASVSDDEFGHFLERRINASSVHAHQLCFEITETSAVRDLAQAQRFIQRVRALGCRFALDDFGAGFCSFAYLKALDVDYFKIDGGFVRDVHTSPLALAIVRSIAEIARVMRKQTIAECTESESIRAHLLSLGVDYAQGFAIDRPMPLAQYFGPSEPDLAMRKAS
jgi:EAL domain-containing protein (putative c-di-GMP-specific phosphodiesterase class I)